MDLWVAGEGERITLCLMSTGRSEPRPLRVLLCYVTDRSQFECRVEQREDRLLSKIAECATAGVDFIQLREKDLSGHELEDLACKIKAILPDRSPARLLINGRVDVALASGAHGTHLPAGHLLPSEARMMWDEAGRSSAPTIGASVHSLEQAALAEAHGADFVLFGPVFAKDGQSNPQGLEQLWQVCGACGTTPGAMPVLAIGGVTVGNAGQCLAAGAAGVAGIRLFQDHPARAVVDQLRSLTRGRITHVLE